MHDELEDKYGEYCSIPHEEWCDNLLTMETKGNRKRDMYDIKRLATSKSEPVNSDSDDSISVPRNKKARTGVLPRRKQHGVKPQIITAHSIIEWCAKSQEWLITNGIIIAMRITPGRYLTINQSRTDWEYPYSTERMLSNIIRKLKRGRKGIWNTLRRKVRWYSSRQINPYHATK